MTEIAVWFYIFLLFWTFIGVALTVIAIKGISFTKTWTTIVITPIGKSESATSVPTTFKRFVIKK